MINPTYKLLKGNELTPYQLYRAKWHLFPEYVIVDRMPIHVDIELNTTCNRSCSYCQQSFDKPKPKIMNDNMALKIIRECSNKGVSSIKLNWRGEPLLHPKLTKYIRYAKKNGIIEVMLNTNGDLLTHSLNNQLLESGLDKMIVSVHEGTDQLALRKKIEDFQHSKWFSKNGNTIVRVQTLDTLNNDDFYNFWDYVADDIGVELEVDIQDKKEDLTLKPNFYCAQLWQRLFIAANGDIVPCCAALEGGNKLLEVIGNIKDMTIEEAWHSPRVNILRDAHKRGFSNHARMCRICGIRKRF